MLSAHCDIRWLHDLHMYVPSHPVGRHELFAYMCANIVTSHLRSDDAIHAFNGPEVTTFRVAGDGASRDP